MFSKITMLDLRWNKAKFKTQHFKNIEIIGVVRFQKSIGNTKVKNGPYGFLNI